MVGSDCFSHQMAPLAGRSIPCRPHQKLYKTGAWRYNTIFGYMIMSYQVGETPGESQVHVSVDGTFEVFLSHD